MDLHLLPRIMGIELSRMGQSTEIMAGKRKGERRRVWGN
jgi:hypothetical protein